MVCVSLIVHPCRRKFAARANIRVPSGFLHPVWPKGLNHTLLKQLAAMGYSPAQKFEPRLTRMKRELDVDEAKRMKELERENAESKKMVADALLKEPRAGGGERKKWSARATTVGC